MIPISGTIEDDRADSGILALLAEELTEESHAFDGMLCFSAELAEISRDQRSAGGIVDHLNGDISQAAMHRKPGSRGRPGYLRPNAADAGGSLQLSFIHA